MNKLHKAVEETLAWMETTSLGIDPDVLANLRTAYDRVVTLDAQHVESCPTCGNAYLAIRTDLYKDKRPFVYCDCCGAMADKKTWITAQDNSKEQK